MQPILRWAGGKTQLLPEIKKLIVPKLTQYNTYFEPFVGGGAVVFDLEYPKSVINDVNAELINVYRVVKDNPFALISELENLAQDFNTQKYYEIRNLDRLPDFKNKSDVFKAARTLFLNKTCFNGLYRVNKKGLFNSPIGRTTTGKIPDIVQEYKILELSKGLKNFKIENTSYEAVVNQAKSGDVIYLDPPYDYEDNHTFIGYNEESFSKKDLDKLFNVCEELTNKGCFVIISNNATTYVLDLFKHWNRQLILANRSLSAKGTTRQKVNEVLLYNF